MDVKYRSVNKNGVKKPFVTKASDYHTSETHVTGVIHPHMLSHAMTSYAYTLKANDYIRTETIRT